MKQILVILTSAMILSACSYTGDKTTTMSDSTSVVGDSTVTVDSTSTTDSVVTVK